MTITAEEARILSQNATFDVAENKNKIYKIIQEEAEKGYYECEVNIGNNYNKADEIKDELIENGYSVGVIQRGWDDTTDTYLRINWNGTRD